MLTPKRANGCRHGGLKVVEKIQCEIVKLEYFVNKKMQYFRLTISSVHKIYPDLHVKKSLRLTFNFYPSIFNVPLFIVIRCCDSMVEVAS